MTPYMQDAAVFVYTVHALAYLTPQQVKTLGYGERSPMSACRT